MGLAETAELAVELNLKGDLRKGLRGAQKDLKGLRRGAGQVGRGMGDIGRGLVRIGKIGAVAAVGGLVVAVKAAGDFEDKMTQSLAIMGKVGAKTRKTMEDTAREIGRTTVFSASEAAESYFFLASAGLSAEQQIAAMPQVAAFAQAGMFDMATATDLATDAQSALGLTVDDSTQNLANLTRVTDVLVKANTLANASVEQFSTALTRKAGTAMRTLGIDIEEGVAVLAVFADQGVKGELAGTTLATTLNGLTKAATTNQKQFKKLGIDVFKNNGELKSLSTVSAIMTRRFGGMSDEQKAAAFNQLGLNRQTKAGIELILGQSDSIKKYEKDLRKSGGTTDKVASKQTKGFNKQLGILRDNLVDLAITVGKPLLKPLTTGVQTITKLLSENQPAVEAFASTLGKFFTETLTEENIRTGLSNFKDLIGDLPIDDIRAGLGFALDIGKKAIGLFNSLPPEVKGALITLLAANKLSGGLIGAGLGGLVKGVLSVAATTITAGVVNVVGPGAAGAGAAGAAAGGGALARLGGIGGAAIAAVSVPVAAVAIKEELEIIGSQLDGSDSKLQGIDRTLNTGFTGLLLSLLPGASGMKDNLAEIKKGVAASDRTTRAVRTIPPPDVDVTVTNNITATTVESKTQKVVRTNRTRANIG